MNAVSQDVPTAIKKMSNARWQTLVAGTLLLLVLLGHGSNKGVGVVVLLLVTATCGFRWNTWATRVRTMEAQRFGNVSQ